MKNALVKVGLFVLVALATVGIFVVGRKTLEKVQNIQSQIKKNKETADLGI